MPGSVIDLSRPGYTIPDPIVVDTNLIVERLIVPLAGTTSSPQVTVNAHRANQFFLSLLATNRTGIVTSTVLNELLHVAIRTKYQEERRRLGSRSRQPFGRTINSWRDLYKADATILQALLPNLAQLSHLLTTNGLLFLPPDVLGPITSGRAYDEELIHLVGTYGLDSNDALILMEAQRAGVRDVITLDADLRRAQADFNIYTWL